MKTPLIFGLLFLICMCLLACRVLAITPLKAYAAIKEASTSPSKPETSNIVTSSVPETANKATVIKSYGKLPLSFERNDGQAPGDVKFLARWGGRVYWFSPKEAILDFAEKEKTKDKVASLRPEAWTCEGIAFYAYGSPQEGSLAVYRFWSEMYHSHHYTISEWERDYIMEHCPEAWTYEGIGFYMYVVP